MKIAVLSGKGGTGKTLVSVNLSAIEQNSCYIDCDVEEPNGHLFFKPSEVVTEEICVKIPKVDKNLCQGCRKCVNFCKFNALAYIKDRLMVFDEVCHSCYGCIKFCPNKALLEKNKAVGKIEKGKSDTVEVLSGVLNTGESSGVPIIKALLSKIKNKLGLSVIDCPPGSACIVMESIKDADFCVLVAEPTLFGVHNLNMVYELVKLFKKPFGVVLNKCIEGENPAETFCIEKKINVLARIPFDSELSEISSNARIAVRESDKYKTVFENLLKRIREGILNEATSNS